VAGAGLLSALDLREPPEPPPPAAGSGEGLAPPRSFCKAGGKRGQTKRRSRSSLTMLLRLLNAFEEGVEGKVKAGQHGNGQLRVGRSLPIENQSLGPGKAR
jgi:hypothetical protein